MRLCLIKMRRKPPMKTLRLPNADLNNGEADRNAKLEEKNFMGSHIRTKNYRKVITTEVLREGALVSSRLSDINGSALKSNTQNQH